MSTPTDQGSTYSQTANDATLALESFLSHKIQQYGDLSFADYMQESLYHPTWGYYTRGALNVGKAGDFYTSVSVGSCFGTILAHRIHRLWLEVESPQKFDLIEIGANNGQLALDLLNAIQAEFPDFYEILQYHIIEHLQAIREIQSHTLLPHSGKYSLHSATTELSEQQGIILSNELIDAFPVHLLQLDDGIWKQRNITKLDEKLSFTLSSQLTPELEQFITDTLEKQNFPNGYQTEYRPSLSNHIAKMGTMLQSYNTITIDYGHTQSSYYAPSRHTGTLRCYHQHQADDNPLAFPGLKDITAHVDFTQLANAFLQHDHKLTHFSSQARYLTEHAKNWLLNIEANFTPENLKLIKQFQTLTHPTIMGYQFHILETSYNIKGNSSNDPDTLEKLEII